MGMILAVPFIFSGMAFVGMYWLEPIWFRWWSIPLGLVLLVIGARLCYDKEFEERQVERRRFYRERDEAYQAALPDTYPYIAGWSGVDPGDMAIVKKGDCEWTVMPMDDALEDGMTVHPAVYDDSYVGDSYRSVNQMQTRRPE